MVIKTLLPRPSIHVFGRWNATGHQKIIAGTIGSLLIVLMLVVASPSAKAQEQVQSRARSTAEHQEAESARSPTGTVYRTVQSPVAKYATNQRQAESNKQLTLYDKLSLVAQYLIFIATLIYAWIANRQLRAIDASAKAATLSAHAALQSNRPIMVVANVKLEGFTAETPSHVREVHASFDFKNCGESVAIVKSIAARLAFADDFASDGLDTTQFERVLNFSDPLIQRGETTKSFGVPYVYGVVIDEARRHLMRQLDKQLQLRGRIDYLDLAKQDRWTTFAYGYSIGYSDKEGAFYRLPDGNEYDAYTDSDQRYQHNQRYFARLKAFLLRKRTRRSVTHP